MSTVYRIPEVRSSGYVTHLFTATLFLSAFLLFLFQPIVSKMLLPSLGGAAGVWTTCVLFFQAMLLAGYIYAHLLSRIPHGRKQVLIHGLVIFLPFAFLPVRFGGASSQWGLLLQLLVSAGMPFFAVSTTGPLLQSWYVRTKHSSSNDPYFLYAGSNAGSLLALIAYPLFIEPAVGVSQQNRLWLGLYALLVLLLTATSGFAWKTPAAEIMNRESGAAPRPAAKTRVYWTIAAFVPSALMLAVTNHISSDLASVPFLWTIPLAIYLLTFIVAFARRPCASTAGISRWIPVVLLTMFPVIAASVAAPAGLNWIVIAGHLILLYCGALLCHTTLAENRPGAQHLTEFYFWIALGGVLGGVFTATLAPLLFNTVFEYPLLVAALPFFRAANGGKDRPVIPIIFGLALLATWRIFHATGADTKTEALALAHTTLIFLCYKFKNHRNRFAFSFAILILAYAWILPPYIEAADRIYVSRNFFGVKKVLEDRNAHLRTLLHGDTIHGMESRDPARIGQPLSYYYRTGNVGQVIDVLRSRGRPQRIGVVGLGSGSMAAYAGTNLHVVFFEIDPSVERLARSYFTFLGRCMSNCDVQTGDGRLKLAKEPDASFDLLMLDAFSSDSIPAHLMSKEAMQLYLAKLRPDGLLLFHTSNRYLDVQKLASALVADAGLIGFSRFDDAGDLRRLGKTSSSHVVGARRIENFGRLTDIPGWVRVTRPRDFPVWTDDYSNLLELIRWH